MPKKNRISINWSEFLLHKDSEILFFFTNTIIIIIFTEIIKTVTVFIHSFSYSIKYGKPSTINFFSILFNFKKPTNLGEPKLAYMLEVIS